MHMTVRRVKQDFNDKSVTIPTSIIVVMNADFNNDYTKESLFSMEGPSRSPVCRDAYWQLCERLTSGV